MNDFFVGRKKEQEVLEKALQSREAEMVAVIGRRRVGKTFLVRSVYQGKIDIEFTGVQNASRREQLDSFHFLVQKYARPQIPLPIPKNWLQAFHQLITVLEQNDKEKKILFFDELPWLATKKSGFLRAMGFFWNNWASKRDIVSLVINIALASSIMN